MSPRIRIDDVYLDEVCTRLQNQYAPRSVSFMRRPAGAHAAYRTDSGVTLRTPAVTALQLLFEGVLRRGERVELTVSGASWGRFVFNELRKEAEDNYGDPVLLLFTRVIDDDSEPA